MMPEGLTREERIRIFEWWQLATWAESQERTSEAMAILAKLGITSAPLFCGDAPLCIDGALQPTRVRA